MYEEEEDMIRANGASPYFENLGVLGICRGTQPEPWEGGRRTLKQIIFLKYSEGLEAVRM